jgi:hypothetical protein
VKQVSSSSIDHGSGKRRSVTASCHIDMAHKRGPSSA